MIVGRLAFSSGHVGGGCPVFSRFWDSRHPSFVPGVQGAYFDLRQGSRSTHTL